MNGADNDYWCLKVLTFLSQNLRRVPPKALGIGRRPGTIFWRVIVSLATMRRTTWPTSVVG